MSNEDEALVLAPRRRGAMSAARHTSGGGNIVDGTSNEGSDDDEADASTTRREYVRSTASNYDKAGATVERLARAARAARPSDGGHPRLRRPSGREAMDTAARRSGTTKAAQHMGVGKAASKGDDVSFCDAYSDTNAGDDTNDDAKRHGQPHDHAINDNDNYDVEETGGHKRAVGHKAAKKRPYPPQDSSTNNGADEEARSPEADEPPPQGGVRARGAAT